MTKKTLGALQRVDLRTYWEDEARDFTPWLASPAGLYLLGETIGVVLELVGQEKRVGPFKADILAQVEGEEEHYVVIENQLGKTNHDHLGKIVTYAAGLKATTIIWIAENFTDEHRQALDWLNENAGENLTFFGLQIELLRIGDSAPAPQFKVVSSPNEWAKSVQADVAATELTGTKQDQLLFWEELSTHAQAHKSSLSLRKPPPQHWYTISVGRAGFWISLTLNSFHKRVGCEVYMRGTHSKEAFDLLKQDKDAIQKEVGAELDWQRLEHKKGSRIALYRKDLLINDAQQREIAKVWLHETAEKFYATFSKRIKALDISDDEVEPEDETEETA